jgi:hypothetical protein
VVGPAFHLHSDFIRSRAASKIKIAGWAEVYLLALVVCLISAASAAREFSEIDFAPGPGAKIDWPRPRNGGSQIL